jgi:hypothetical protein
LVLGVITNVKVKGLSGTAVAKIPPVPIDSLSTKPPQIRCMLIVKQ